MHHWALCNRVFPRISLTLPFRFKLSPLCFDYNITPFYLLSSYVLLSQFQSYTYLGGARQLFTGHTIVYASTKAVLAVSEI
jgi:hypothetical protein